MQYTMKTSILVLLAGTFLFVIVQTQDNLVKNTTTNSCGVNEMPTSCVPCDPKCTGGALFCPDVIIVPVKLCAGSPIFCSCKTNFSRISSNDTRCVPTKMCYLYVGKNHTKIEPVIEY